MSKQNREKDEVPGMADDVEKAPAKQADQDVDKVKGIFSSEEIETSRLSTNELEDWSFPQEDDCNHYPDDSPEVNYDDVVLPDGDPEGSYYDAVTPYDFPEDRYDDAVTPYDFPEISYDDVVLLDGDLEDRYDDVVIPVDSPDQFGKNDETRMKRIEEAARKEDWAQACSVLSRGPVEGDLKQYVHSFFLSLYKRGMFLPAFNIWRATRLDGGVPCPPEEVLVCDLGNSREQLGSSSFILFWFFAHCMRGEEACPVNAIRDFHELERSESLGELPRYVASLPKRSPIVQRTMERARRVLGSRSNEELAATLSIVGCSSPIRTQIIQYLTESSRQAGWELRQGTETWCDKSLNNSIGQLVHRIRRHDARIAEVRIQERSRVIADLSHHIKNLVASTTASLEELKERVTSISSRSLEHALRGASLIREIVQAVNLSYRGSGDDLKSDARLLPAEGVTGITELVSEAACAAVADMFDTKYFTNFSRNYFPDRSSFVNARNAWTTVLDSGDGSISSVEAFMQNHMIQTKFDLDDVSSFGLSDTRGSKIKMLILLNELLLNAVKYASLSDSKNREMSLSMKQGKVLCITVSNTHTKSNARGKVGLGREIIQNTVKSFGGRVVEEVHDAIYSVRIEIPNVWEGE